MTVRHAMLTSALRYQDPAAAIDWLCQALGFIEHFVARDDKGKVVHAQLKFGNALLYLGPDHPGDVYGMRSPRALAGTNQCICIALDGREAVDTHYTRAKEAGAAMIDAPHDTEYGAHAYSCRDPEGHVWNISDYFGEP